MLNYTAAVGYSKIITSSPAIAQRHTVDRGMRIQCRMFLSTWRRYDVGHILEIFPELTREDINVACLCCRTASEALVARRELAYLMRTFRGQDYSRVADLFPIHRTSGSRSERGDDFALWWAKKHGLRLYQGRRFSSKGFGVWPPRSYSATRRALPDWPDHESSEMRYQVIRSLLRARPESLLSSNDRRSE